MEILGVGIPELIFVVIIALLVLGPKDMQKTGKMIGKWLRDLTRSEGWKIFQQTSREIRTLPTKLIREANDELNQINREINPASQIAGKGYHPTKQPPRSQSFSTDPTPKPLTDNKISPAESEPNENESDQPNNA
jgi:Sec-independent protein translocase protein TatA